MHQKFRKKLVHVELQGVVFSFLLGHLVPCREMRKINLIALVFISNICVIGFIYLAVCPVSLA